MMQSHVFGAACMAACPQFPYALAGESREMKPRDHKPSRATDILAISAHPALGHYLSGMFRPPEWAVATVDGCEQAASFAVGGRAAVAVCEQSLPDGCWRDAAAAFRSIPDAPALVVVGDDRSLLREVLAMGGFDVLVRPLRDAEVLWTVASAWHAWLNRFEAGHKGGTSSVDVPEPSPAVPPVVQLERETSDDAGERVRRDSHR